MKGYKAIKIILLATINTIPIMQTTEELDRRNPLFDGPVPVVLRADQRDERTAALIIRVLTGSRVGHGQRERLLHIEITDDTDPFFLYTLDVSEDEFHRLKHDQSLLVEFADFSTNVIALLNACNETSATFSAVLDTSEDSSAVGEQDCIFSIVESNQFKVLKHLALRFRAGTDSTTKTYLAERLQQFQQDNVELHSQVENLSETLSTTQEERNANKISLDTFMSRQENAIESLTNQYDSEKSSITSNFNAQLATLQRDQSISLREAQEHHEATTADLRTRCEKLESERATLLENRAVLAAEKTQLAAAHQGSGDLIVTLRSEISELRQENQHLDETNFQNVKTLTQITAQLEAQTQEIEDKSTVVNQMQMRLEESGEQRAQLEDALSLLRDNQERLHQKFQDSVHEINKGNDIIQKLQQENKQLRAKLKIKSKVLRRQEEKVSEKDREIEDYHRKQLSLEAELVREQDEKNHLQTNVNRLNKKLNESKQLLESNQQVIKWLNQEINAVQLNGRRTLGPSAASLGLKELEQSSAFRFKPRQPLHNTSSNINIAPQYRPLKVVRENDTTPKYTTMTAKMKSIDAPQEFSAVGMFGDDVPLPLQSVP